MPYGKIANMAVNRFFDISKAASAASAEVLSTRASNNGDVIERGEQPALSRLEAMRKQGARPWNILSSVDKGFEIPIAITSACAVPELGAQQLKLCCRNSISCLGPSCLLHQPAFALVCQDADRQMGLVFEGAGPVGLVGRAFRAASPGCAAGR